MLLPVCYCQDMPPTTQEPFSVEGGKGAVLFTFVLPARTLLHVLIVLDGEGEPNNLEWQEHIVRESFNKIGVMKIGAYVFSASRA